MENIENKNNNFKKSFNRRKRFRPNKKIATDDYKPNCSNEIFNILLEDLDFTDKTFTALKKGGIICLGQLACKTERDMYKIQCIGKKNCIEILNKLMQYNLDFKPDTNKVDNKEEKNKENNEQNQNKKENKKNLNYENNLNKNKQNLNKQKEENNKEQKKQKLNKQKNKKEIKQFELDKINDFMEKPIHNKINFKTPYIKITKNQKTGLLSQNKKEIIPPEYNEIFYFSDGLACVCVEINGEEKYGYINELNEFIIEPIFDLATSFSESYASVTINNKSGYINTKGEIVIELIYDCATPFHDGKAYIRQADKWGFIDKNLKIDWEKEPYNKERIRLAR